ncbi:regulating synaptic membrane exocytosis protein 4 isoform X2 [Pogoniulus pusillus]|uniref:regulating synaptic membrane exocytosis protein 4 isoform X2 n=1 Tax=Pogoniulus pusillus TaxID=488313 RepID=UPI0030B92212
MERSQSRLSLSASFEALAIYFPCMNSFDEEDADGDGRRLKGAIQRSTETGLAVEMPSRTIRQASHESIEDSMNSYGSEGNLNFSGVHLASAGQFSDFLGSMGPAQFVGRQTLATTSMGDVEIGLQERNGQLEVDIIQARGLTPKPGSKTLPAAYIKAYLLENGVCIAKKKTKVARKSLDPLYNQVLLFAESPQGKVLQGKDAVMISQRSLVTIFITHDPHLLFTTWTRSGVSHHLCLQPHKATCSRAALQHAKAHDPSLHLLFSITS